RGAARAPALVRRAGRARARLQPLRAARGRGARGRPACARGARRRAGARRARRRREPADDEVERVRVRSRADEARRPLRHAPRAGRSRGGAARRRARARPPPRRTRVEGNAAHDGRRGRRRGRRVGRSRNGRRRPAQPAEDPARRPRSRARRNSAADVRPAPLGARRRPARARADARPVRIRVGHPLAGRLEPLRPRPAAAVVPRPLHPPDAARAARGRARLEGRARVTHDHAHRARHDRVPLLVALALILALMGGEIAAGIVAGSLALLADAGHLLTDAAGPGFAAVAATLVLSRASRDSLNVRGAFIHVATDSIAFAATATAGAVVLATGWNRVDALAGLAVAGLMVWSSIGLLRESGRIFLEAAPAE